MNLAMRFAIAASIGWACCGGSSAANQKPESAGEAAEAARCAQIEGSITATSLVTANHWVEAGAFKGLAQDGKTIANLPAFCRITLHSSLSSDSSIETEVWLPGRSKWNNRFAGIGNGGFAGSINPGDERDPAPSITLASALRRGFAAALTDMGTAGLHSGSGDNWVGHPVKWLDFGSRSTHEMTVAAKALILRFYGEKPRHSYFQGCSTGGMQAIREAESYPDDYDGILAGAPGNNRARLFLSIFYNYTVPKMNPAGLLNDAKLSLIHSAVLRSCADRGGGSETDPFVTSPMQCKWRPETLLCKGSEQDDCLTAEQAALANALYEGPRDPVTGESFFPGLPRGTEPGWSAYMTPFPVQTAAPPGYGYPPEPYFMGQLRMVFGNIDWRKFDWHRDAQTFLQIVAPLLDANTQDLSEFAKRGGKLLAYAGWADTTGSTIDTVNYYQGAVAQKKNRQVSNAVQLFMMPGMGHCRGGAGPNAFDGIGALSAWVEQGRQPDSIIATVAYPANAELAMSRPLCAYPAVANYKGTGDPQIASSYSCGVPAQLSKK